MALEDGTSIYSTEHLQQADEDCVKAKGKKLRRIILPSFRSLTWFRSFAGAFDVLSSEQGRQGEFTISILSARYKVLIPTRGYICMNIIKLINTYMDPKTVPLIVQAE